MKFSSLALFAGAASAAVIGQRDTVDETAIDIKAIFDKSKCQSAVSFPLNFPHKIML